MDAYSKDATRRPGELAALTCMDKLQRAARNVLFATIARHGLAGAARVLRALLGLSDACNAYLSGRFAEALAPPTDAQAGVERMGVD
jgi:hypothetical protein